MLQHTILHELHPSAAAWGREGKAPGDGRVPRSQEVNGNRVEATTRCTTKKRHTRDIYIHFINTRAHTYTYVCNIYAEHTYMRNRRGDRRKTVFLSRGRGRRENEREDGRRLRERASIVIVPSSISRELLECHGLKESISHCEGRRTRWRTRACTRTLISDFWSFVRISHQVPGELYVKIVDMQWLPKLSLIRWLVEKWCGGTYECSSWSSRSLAPDFFELPWLNRRESITGRVIFGIICDLSRFVAYS